MKVSVIIPVKNEEKTIKDLLNSLLSQSRKPDEIVITDGGSCDKTVEIINQYIKERAPIQLIQEKEALPGRGRNVAIAKAKYDTIAMTDAGVILDKHWLENLILPFGNGLNLEIVYGVHGCYAKTLFEKCFAIVYIHQGNKLNGKRVNYPYLGSTAIKKQVWEKIGGFREDLRAAEDILFFKKIEEMKFKTVVAPEAIAYWRPRSSLREAFVLSFKYAECDALTSIHIKDYVRKYLTYFLGTSLLFMGIKNTIFIFILVLGWLLNNLLICKKNWGQFKRIILAKPQAYFIIIAIILALDIGRMSGFLNGMFKKYFRNRVLRGFFNFFLICEL